MNQKIKKLSKELINKNIKPSFQRIKVLEYLTTRKIHSTVDEIFNVLSKEIPTLSKATLYNTLFINIDELKTDLDNFKIHEKDVYFRGLCPNCLNIKQ